MNSLVLRLFPITLSLIGIVAASTLPTASAEDAAVAGYTTAGQFTARIEALRGKPGVAVQSLAKTAAGTDVWLITLGTGDYNSKPAIAIVGSVDPARAIGAELSLSMAEQMANTLATTPAISELLKTTTVYIIPRPSPDAMSKMFQRPFSPSSGNANRSDDDRDFSQGEDPPEDLDGDGWITQMRVESPVGTHVAHPDDPRILVPADPALGERGKYLVYSEGVDNDHDEQWNEDPGNGTHFDRNFPFQYGYFDRGAGPHQVSEPETRAVTDFLYERTNIAVVFSFSAENNLMSPPKGAAEAKRIRTQVIPEDAAAIGLFAEKYQAIQTAKDAPPSVETAGGFSRWAYFHYGRWSLSTNGWWVPKVDAPKPESSKPAAPAVSNTPATTPPVPTTPVATPAVATPETIPVPTPADVPPAQPAAPTTPVAAPTAGATEPATPAAPVAPAAATQPTELPPAAAQPVAAQPDPTQPAATQPVQLQSIEGATEKKPDEKKVEKKPDNRAAAERNLLRWFAAQNIDGFSNWKAIQHPDFPGKVVEVGGFRPFVADHVPAAELQTLSQKHVDFLLAAASMLPKLELAETKIETVGSGVYRLTVTVMNSGRLPTSSEMGRVTGEPYPLQLTIGLPTGGTALTGSIRKQLSRLAGSGGKVTETLLFTAPTEGARAVTIRVHAPHIGEVSSTITLP